MSDNKNQLIFLSYNWINSNQITSFDQDEIKN